MLLMVRVRGLGSWSACPEYSCKPLRENVDLNMCVALFRFYRSDLIDAYPNVER